MINDVSQYKPAYSVTSGEKSNSQASYCYRQFQQLPLITQRKYNETRDGESFNWARKGGKLASFEEGEVLPLEYQGYLGFSHRAIVDERIPRECGNRRPLAYKQVRCDHQDLTIKKAWEEVKNMRGLNHPHVVRMVAACIQGNSLGILMYPPAPAGGNLDSYTSSISTALQHQTSLPEKIVERLVQLPRNFVCLSEGLRYLHDLNIKHKDIKPSNILIDAFGSPIFTDFDISHRYLDAAKAVTDGATRMTYNYASPEAANDGRRALESDIFSLGAVFLDLSTLIVGRSLEIFRDFRRNGKDISFHKNLEKLYQWIAELETIPVNQYPTLSFRDHTLRHKNMPTLPDMRTTFQNIRLMLSETPELRPKAASLPPRFHHICYFVCPDCDQRAEKPYKPTIQDHPWASDDVFSSVDLNTASLVSIPTNTNNALPVNIGLSSENNNFDVYVVRPRGREPSAATSTIASGGIRPLEQVDRRCDHGVSVVEQRASSEQPNSILAHQSWLQRLACPLERSKRYCEQNLLVYDKSKHRLCRLPAVELNGTFNHTCNDIY